MTKREAMRRVCRVAEAILNIWLEEDDGQGPLLEADKRRMRDAFEALCAEPRRRAGN